MTDTPTMQGLAEWLRTAAAADWLGGLAVPEQRTFRRWITEVESASALAEASNTIAQPVAWMWQYIGKDPLRVHIKPCARALHEMDPKNPPYPDAWKPVAPLYAHPAPKGEAEEVLRELVEAMNAFNGTSDGPAAFAEKLIRINRAKERARALTAQPAAGVAPTHPEQPKEPK